MYDQESFRKAWDLCKVDSLEETRQACTLAWRQGLKTPWKDGTLQDLARSCLDLAQQGLDREQIRHGGEQSESCFLDGLEELIEGGQTLAEQLLQNWQGSRSDKLKALIGHCGFFDVATNRADGDCANAHFNPAN